MFNSKYSNASTCCNKEMDIVEGSYTKHGVYATFKMKCSVCGRTKVGSCVLQNKKLYKRR